MGRFLRSIWNRLLRRGNPAAAGMDGPDTAPLTEEEPDEPHLMSASDTLDLHAFHPRDLPSVVREFLREAREHRFLEVRIIHGRGTGLQRDRVRRLLAEDPGIVSFGDAPDASGWGATVARLSPREEG